MAHFRIFFGKSGPPAQTLTPGLVVDSDTFYAPSIAVGAVTLTPGLVTDTDTFYSSIVAAGAVTLTPSLVTDVDTFYAPSIVTGAVTLTPGLVTDTDTFYPPIVTHDQVLAPLRVVDVDTIYSPTISIGAITLQPGLVTDLDVIYAARAVYDQTLIVSLLVDADSIYAPVLSIGAVILQPGFITDVDVIYAPTILRSDWIISHDLGRFIDLDVIYPPGAPSVFTLLPELVTDAFEMIIPPSLARALNPALMVDDDTVFAPSLTLGPVTILPQRVIDLDVIYIPFVSIQVQQGGGGGGGGGNNPKDIKYASSMVMAQSGLITAIGAQTTTAKLINCRMAIYSNANTPTGPRRAVSETKTAMALGNNIFQLLVPYAVVAGQTIWIAFQGDATVNWLLQNFPGGSRFNNDLFSDGISDPFGNSSIDNRKAPLFAIYMQSATATISPQKVDADETVYSPSISASNTLDTSIVISDDAIWTPTVVTAINEEVPELFVDDDVIPAPTVSAYNILLPGLVIDSDIIIPPAFSTTNPPDVTISSADFVDQDVIYTAEVIPMGGTFPAGIYIDPDDIPAPVVTFYNELLVDDPVNDPDVFYDPTVIAENIMAAELWLDEDIFYTPALTVELQGQNVVMDLFADEDVFYPPRVLLARIPITIFGEKRSSATLLGSTTGRQVNIKGSNEEE